MSKIYFYSSFKVNDNGAADIVKKDRFGSNGDIECTQLLSISKENDNIWNADIDLEIYANKEGIGFCYTYPGGYSSYTYDPDETRNFYYGATLEWFLKFGLDQDQRDMLSLSDAQVLEEKFKEIK